MKNLTNPYMARQQQKGQTGSGRVSETRVARQLGARLVPNSGSVRGMKSDMATKRAPTGKVDGMDLAFRIEAKSTKAMSMSLEYAWLGKIVAEAMSNGQVPALTVSFTNDAGAARPYGDWVAIPLNLFHEMVSALECKDDTE